MKKQLTFGLLTFILLTAVMRTTAEGRPVHCLFCTYGYSQAFNGVWICSGFGCNCVLDVVVNIPDGGGYCCTYAPSCDTVKADTTEETLVGTDLYQCFAVTSNMAGINSVFYSHTGRDVIDDVLSLYPSDTQCSCH